MLGLVGAAVTLSIQAPVATAKISAMSGAYDGKAPPSAQSATPRRQPVAPVKKKRKRRR